MRSEVDTWVSDDEEILSSVGEEWTVQHMFIINHFVYADDNLTPK